MEAALEQLLSGVDSVRRREFLANLAQRVSDASGERYALTQTPYRNTIFPEDEPDYPGDLEHEGAIENLVRWNAMAMVVSANQRSAGLGGHISTFASIATLYEVGQNHFFRGATDEFPGDMIYFQGHASPGNYARAFLEGYFDEAALRNFRRDTKKPGLSSYPHPYLMPDFWQFPTVSMGLGPICSIYQARYGRYLEARELCDAKPHVWAFVGDGEMDEPETTGALALAAREGLDNLTWVVDCNLQRLDGPVRGNAKVIQELEQVFRGAGWNVIKLIWGSEWDDLFARDEAGALQRRLEACVDGDFQNFSASDGATIRRELFNTDSLREMVAHLKDDELTGLRRGGHDPVKIHAAYRAAWDHQGAPTVILAKTVKGFGLGEAGAGLNTTHQQKSLGERELRAFRDRFGLAISDAAIADAPFYRPPADSPEMRYLQERREALGGYAPRRMAGGQQRSAPELSQFKDFLEGGDEATTTSALVRMLNELMRDRELGDRITPIIPDEARTFGFDALFRQHGIYAAGGQQYEPVDSNHFLYYREDAAGQILEEGITEAGSMGSFIAAGSSYSTRGLEMIPFYLFYSMFGFQRVGDLIWAAGDSLAKGFLLGCTAGRTTLNGEGLQHQDGHSLLTASAHPSIRAYDPAFAYEVALIVHAGLQRMLDWNEPALYYLTLYNEALPMPAMPPEAKEGAIKGLYRFRAGPAGERQAHILASGVLMQEALRAQTLLDERYGVRADVWSATSYQLLRREALEVERWNRQHPGEEPRTSFVSQSLAGEEGPFVAVSDYVSLVPDQISPWVPGGLTALGTDGFGRSGTREELRRFFQVDAESIAGAVLADLSRRGELDSDGAQRALDELSANETPTEDSHGS